MSTITNEPILLDSTGRAILEQMNRQNSYLAMMAEGKRSDIYSSMSQIASIVRGNNVDNNKKIFPIGDQIIVPWKDMDDSTHNTDETAYQVALNIVHHGEVTLETGEVVPGMYLQWHYCSPYGVQFSHQQAFLNCSIVFVIVFCQFFVRICRVARVRRRFGSRFVTDCRGRVCGDSGSGCPLRYPRYRRVRRLIGGFSPSVSKDVSTGRVTYCRLRLRGEDAEDEG